MAAFWMIIIVGIISLAEIMYYNKNGLKKVSYSRTFSKKKVFVGDKVELVEVLSNNKLLPMPWVRIESRLSPWLRFRQQENLDINMDQFHKSMFFMWSYSRITRRHEITCLRRGYYDCSLVSLTSGELFGIGINERDLVCDAKLFVYPRILKADEMPDTALKWQGDVAVRRWIMPDPILVSGIRGYRYGDNMKDVHWGATARTGELQVKVRDFTVSPKVMLLFNSQISEKLWNEMEQKDKDFLESGLSCCATLAAWCIENSIDVGFHSNGMSKITEKEFEPIEPECSQGHLDMLLEALAGFDIKMRYDFHTILDREIDSGRTGADILIVSAYWNSELDERAKTLREMGNSVTYIPIKGGSI